MDKPEKPSLHKRVSYQAILLGGFAAMAAVFLVSGNLVTKEPIAERKKEDLQATLNQVIPAGLYDNNLLDDTLLVNDNTLVYRGFDNKQVSALAWELSEQGYAGEIRIMMGLDRLGNILGVRVLSHSETPGLGDKIEPEKDDWILEFNGLSLGNPPLNRWKVKKDGGQFDAFSGATITPRAVVKGIRQGLTFFKQNRDQLLAPVAAKIPSDTEKTGEKNE